MATTQTTYAWITDPHMDFLSDTDIDRFWGRVSSLAPSGVLLGGDISTSSGLVRDLDRIADIVGVPVYFVLGNHDFYGSDFASVRERVSEYCAEHRNLIWLTEASDPIALSDRVALIGHDSWADGRAGSYELSDVKLRDYIVIQDFIGRSRTERLALMQEMADQAALTTAKRLSAALEQFTDIILLTHVPPFPETCLGPDLRADVNYLPHFCSQIMGTKIYDIMAAHPDKRLLVLSGHTHTKALAHILPNLMARVGQVEYGRTDIAEIIDIGAMDTLMT